MSNIKIATTKTHVFQYVRNLGKLRLVLKQSQPFISSVAWNSLGLAQTNVAMWAGD